MSSRRLMCHCSTTISISSGSYHSWRRRQIPRRRHITVTSPAPANRVSPAGDNRSLPDTEDPASPPLHQTLRRSPADIDRVTRVSGVRRSRTVDWFNINRTGQRLRRSRGHLARPLSTAGPKGRSLLFPVLHPSSPCRTGLIWLIRPVAVSPGRQRRRPAVPRALSAVDVVVVVGEWWSAQYWTPARPGLRPPDSMYLIRRASARVAAAKNNGTSDLWRSHSGVVRRRLFLLYATRRARLHRHSSIINPPQRQCELFVSRNVSPVERNCFAGWDGGGRKVECHRCPGRCHWRGSVADISLWLSRKWSCAVEYN